MTHPLDLALAGSAGTLGSDFWVTFDEAFMDACAEMIVLDIPGWQESNGVRREIAHFEARDKPVRFMSELARE